MKAHAALLSLAVLFALAGAEAVASTSTMPASARVNEVSKAPPATLSAPDLPTARHRFPVMDEKGLLLTCVAPEIETNSDTDEFKNCTLAPGRTLDDVMHTFVSAIHAEQRRQAEERAGSQKDAEVKSDQKASQK
ncbi:MAG TPA: hypothetical protein VMQ56_09180 [Terracidiphilus sp.]|jgi:hypothetical protein|nr:hypothetical protein [Terracidiphilus sp.]